MDFVDTNNGWAVEDSGVILHTDDGGNSWTRQTSDAWDWLASVDFIDSQTGWIVCPGGEPNNGIYYTNDGGENWVHLWRGWGFLGVSFTDGSHGWTAGAAGRIVHTSDGGVNWIGLTGGYERLTGVDFADAKNGWAAGYGHGFRTSNWGATWNAKIGYSTDVDFVDANHGWVVAEAGTIRYTDDGGDSWTEQDSGVDVGYRECILSMSAMAGWLEMMAQFFTPTMAERSGQLRIAAAYLLTSGDYTSSLLNPAG